MRKRKKNTSPYDRKGREIHEGDIIHYWAGSRRDILQKYVAESLSVGPAYHKNGPNTFRSVGYDGRLQHTHLSLYCLDEWSEVVGNIQETPIGESAARN